MHTGDTIILISRHNLMLQEREEGRGAADIAQRDPPRRKGIITQNLSMFNPLQL